MYNPWWLRCKETACGVGDLGLIPGLGRSPKERNELLPPVFLPGEFQGQKSLASYTPWGHKGSDTTEQPRTMSIYCIVQEFYSLLCGNLNGKEI